MKKFIATATALGTSALLFAAPILAADQTFNLCEGDQAFKLCQLTLPKIVASGVQLILVVAFLLALIFLIIGGIKWIMSGGDKAGTESAKGTITAALIGLIVVFIAWAVVNFLGNFFGLGNVTSPTIKPIQ